MYLMKVLVFIFLIGLKGAYAQKHKTLFSEKYHKYEDSLKKIAFKVVNDSTSDSRMEANAKFIKAFAGFLKLEKSFYYPFDSLKNIRILNDPLENKFRIITWYVVLEQNKCRFYGAIQINNTKKPEIYPLIDAGDFIENLSSFIGNGRKWPGAVYYDIIPPQDKEKKQPFILLGWRRLNQNANQRLIEPLSINKEGPVFGAPVLTAQDGKVHNRMIFEYSGTASMMLKYSERDKTIVFDHLTYVSEARKGISLYAPDLSYDALKYANGRWIFKSDVQLKNTGSEKDNLYSDPKKLKKIK